MARESFTITDAEAWVVLDSRGSETIEVTLYSGKVFATASAPSGKSRGSREAVPFPEGGAKQSVKIFTSSLRRRLVGRDPADQTDIDTLLKEVDGTENFSKIGGNLAYAVSACSVKLAAMLKQKPTWRHVADLSGLAPVYPIPLGNVLGGGAHAGEGAPDIQEFLVFPRKPGSVEEAVRMNVEVHKRLGKVLAKKVGGYGGGKGDEGAYAPPVDDEKALEAVKEASEGLDVGFGLDVAASSLYDAARKNYHYRNRGKHLTREQHMQHISELVEKYGISYVEDPFEETDVEGFAELCRAFPKLLVCGDDLVVTRAELIRWASEKSAVKAVILKPNQVGTITDTVEAAKEAEKRGIVRVVSHRSGETCDSFLTHLAIGLGGKFIKAGVAGGERVAKANELLRIWYKAGGSISLQEADMR